MFRIILALLILIPVMEIAVFIWIGQYIGIGWTLLLIVSTALLGAWLAKREGTQVIRLAQVQIQNRDMPSEAILDGICVLVGGIFLITPGFVTDLVGFFLLIPYTRSIFKAWLKLWFGNLIRKRTVGVMIKRR
ncbi:FxsA family protein [Pueribacillus sp. YX66]|uniref:FxsA family protein n=1 Tax=Pueribacillus sp. YX66 TaxID=3229242 RepID=UPI00358D82BE